MAILGHRSNSTVKVVFAYTLTLYLLVSKGIARTGILERHSMLLVTFMNFFVSKVLTFENLWEEYHLVSIHVIAAVYSQQLVCPGDADVTMYD